MKITNCMLLFVILIACSSTRIMETRVSNDSITISALLTETDYSPWVIGEVKQSIKFAVIDDKLTSASVTNEENKDTIGTFGAGFIGFLSGLVVTIFGGI